MLKRQAGERMVRANESMNGVECETSSTSAAFVGIAAALEALFRGLANELFDLGNL
jgi:hypothetical protein